MISALTINPFGNDIWEWLSPNILPMFLAIVVGYLFGSLNGALIISRIKGVDVRTKGSKNAGATNVLRVFGGAYAIVVLLIDILKAVLPMLILSQYALIVGVFVILGHNFPLYFGFRGGKGVITSATVICFVYPIIGAIMIVVSVIVIAVSRYVSLGSVTGAVLLPVLAVYFNTNMEFKIFSVAACILVIYLHRTNIKRLLGGTENRLGKKHVK